MLLILNRNIDVTTMSVRMDAINLLLGKPVVICSDTSMVEQVRRAV